MKLLDRTFATPAENLAADEVLLDLCEEQGVEVLRFWESPVPFVVAGYGNRIATEVNVTACAARRVPILRRCSGGGTVLQGAGCLNYAVTLRVNTNIEIATVTGANKFVMERIRAAMTEVLGRAVSIEGCTDLALREANRLLKFSGNAQRRRRESLLFHGTILYAFDLSLIAELLRAPSKEPDYRARRDHGEFITNVSATPEAVKDAIARVWSAREELSNLPTSVIESLARERYSTESWNADR